MCMYFFSTVGCFFLFFFTYTPTPDPPLPPHITPNPHPVRQREARTKVSCRSAAGAVSPAVILSSSHFVILENDTPGATGLGQTVNPSGGG